MLRVALCRGLFVLLALCGVSRADHPSVEASPPVGVFGELVHTKGDLMFSYRYQRHAFEGLMDGDRRVDGSAVIAEGKAAIPTALRENRHVFEVMWVPSEEITVVLRLPFIHKELDEVEVASGTPFTTRSEGFGDLELALLYRVFEDERARVHLNLGLSVPTGSINQTDTTPASLGDLVRLPYAMQLGSGTVDLIPGFTYNGRHRKLAWGAQIKGRLHAGTNDAGYRSGNDYHLTTWFGARWWPWVQTSFRLSWDQWFNPVGEDDQLDPMSSPLADPSMQAGRRLDALFGIDFYKREGWMAGTSLSIEAGLPAYQNLDGPQLRTKWLLTAGLQKAF